ncbi:hypothetical protein [Bacillus sp. C1]
MSIGNIFSILSIIVFIYVLWGRRKEIKETYTKLTITQLIGIMISYIVAIFVAFLFIYYGRIWIVDYIPYAMLKMIISIMMILVVLYCCGQVLNRILKRITRDIL